MYKMYLKDLKPQIKTMIKSSLAGGVYRLNNGDFLKIYSPIFKSLLGDARILEDKVMDAKPIDSVPEIIVPKCAVYDYPNNFVGYVTSPALGVDLNAYDENFSLQRRSDLTAYTSFFTGLIDAVKRANKEQIVFPDLCTCDNIFVKCGRISFIDYDGLQVGRHKVFALSTTLGDEEQYYCPKYFQQGLFTPELDKKSMVLLYFLFVFNIDLNKIGHFDPTGHKITLEDIFEIIGLEDTSFMDKVKKILSSNQDGDYIDEDIVRIDQSYAMKVMPFGAKTYLKKLYKK